jgi:hypothetical protein
MNRIKAFLALYWGVLGCFLAAGPNLAFAAYAQSTAQLWLHLLLGGWVAGWGMAGALYMARFRRDAPEIIAAARDEISRDADRWARESIRQVLAQAKREGVIPRNVSVFLSDDPIDGDPPSSTKH